MSHLTTFWWISTQTIQNYRSFYSNYFTRSENRPAAVNKISEITVKYLLLMSIVPVVLFLLNVNFMNQYLNVNSMNKTTKSHTYTRAPQYKHPTRMKHYTEGMYGTLDWNFISAPGVGRGRGRGAGGVRRFLPSILSLCNFYCSSQ